jgi:hypothetical protein
LLGQPSFSRPLSQGKTIVHALLSWTDPKVPGERPVVLGLGRLLSRKSCLSSIIMKDVSVGLLLRSNEEVLAWKLFTDSIGRCLDPLWMDLSSCPYVPLSTIYRCPFSSITNT